MCCSMGGVVYLLYIAQYVFKTDTLFEHRSCGWSHSVAMVMEKGRFGQSSVCGSFNCTTIKEFIN